MLGLATGILVDRNATLSTTSLFLGFAVGCVAWIFFQTARRMHAAAVAVVVICGFVSAIHHHLIWHSLPATDIAPLLSQERVLVRCEGIVASAPVVTPARKEPFGSGPPRQESTQFCLNILTLNTSEGQRTVSGSLRILVDGTLSNVNAGDRVDVQGWAQANRPVLNPGGFDVEALSRSIGVRGIIRVRQPELIRVVQASASFVEKARRVLRARAEAVLQSALPEDIRSVADAMLLGDRSTLHRDLRVAFVESGTIHLLAISGLHIGILMMFLLLLGRAMQLTGRQSVVVSLVILFVYLQVADCRPPMIRAFVIILIWSLARLTRRPAFSANSLAVAAIVILAMNPTNLFDVGSQLSFLAVAVIFWLTTLTRRTEGEPDVAVAGDKTSNAANSTVLQASNGGSVIEDLRHPWLRPLRSVARTLGSAWLLSGGVWAISTPLVVSIFHVVSPAGLLINVVLIPFVGAGLCFGFASILLGILSETIAVPFAIVFGWVLRALITTVNFAASIDLGHAYVPAPPAWWLIAFYGVIAFAMVATTLRHRPQRCWCSVGMWLIFGLTLIPADRAEGSLRCSVLSVGHGLSVLVETPSGQTLVYDVGSRGGGEFSAGVLEDALWNRDVSKVDALIISHSDVDHYNGVPVLLDTVPVARLFCSRHFPDAKQPLTLLMFERAAELGIDPQIVARGDRINLDENSAIRILQPVATTSYESDNASSIVVEIEYRNRRILLTGDLDEDGLRELLDQPPRNIDVLLAPHHGEPDANPRALAAWALPEWVIASAPSDEYRKELIEHYGADTRVIMTSESGAVCIEVTNEGDLKVIPFVSGSGVTEGKSDSRSQ
ncbi:MAG: ComEC/Rec2 family competence protein [Planctomycetota bacterium]|nr:ComEC/Rec2 family competence protein [Planctomycetota bacterium]